MVSRVQAEWRAQIETMLDDYRRLRSQLAGLATALADLTETVRSIDGTVTVTVDRSGRLVALDLNLEPDPGHRPDPSAVELAARIVSTAGLAAQRVATRARTLIGETLPPQHATVLAGDIGIADLLPADVSDPAWLGRPR
jgi:hypothetical protein